MIKNFYKPVYTVPTFFDRNVSVRSSAYGADVKRAFLSWRDYFVKSWNDRSTDILLSEQGDIGGNNVRSDGVSVVVTKPDRVESRPSSSVLPPLLLGDSFIEVGEEGGVSVNKQRTGLNVGSELKGWALSVDNVGERSGGAHLAVIGKPPGCAKTMLALYGYPPFGALPKPVDAIEIPTTLAPQSFIACYGRHIFIVHDAKLDYFYFCPETDRLERCAIGDDGDNASFAWCNCVNGGVVCDADGNVYWATDDAIYGFEIGAPRRLKTVDSLQNIKSVRLRCYGNKLFCFCRRKNGYERMCYSYSPANGEVYEKKLFNTDVLDNMFLWQNGGELAYIKLIPREERTVGQVMKNVDGKETPLGAPVAADKNMFCCFGSIVESGRYAGIDRSGKILAVK